MDVGRFGCSPERPHLGSGHGGILGSFASRFNPEKATQNLENFRKAYTYLREKYGDFLPPKLDSKLAAQLEHYQSNGRGVDGAGGRLSEFTDEDLSKLERDIEKEISNIKDVLAKRDAFIGSLDLSATQKSLLTSISGIEGLSAAQASYVAQYCEDIINNGNKESFALEIGKAMAILYKNGVESELPLTITLDRENPRDNDTVYRDVEMRRTATEFLTRVMAENGANYIVMKDYFQSQQSNSWSFASLGMKAFFLQQRDLERTDLRVEQGQDPMVAEAQRYFLQGFSPNSPNPKKNLLEIFKDYKDSLKKTFLKRPNSNGDWLGIFRNYWWKISFSEETYAKTVVLYKAFTGITLQHLDMPEYIDRENRTISLQRSLSLKHVDKPQGIADSTALDTPMDMNAAGGDTTILLRMPLCDVHALFFMSPELSTDNSPIFKDSSGMEHEVICDMSHADKRILQRRAQYGYRKYANRNCQYRGTRISIFEDRGYSCRDI
ncbi:MAG: hypothetical protein LBJ94_00130 [Puniceicoccales bacterium]|jgi:hypothetical protein|nr:hypothetical protein [Puniceicoccales bacterium]